MRTNSLIKLASLLLLVVLMLPLSSIAHASYPVFDTSLSDANSAMPSEPLIRRRTPTPTPTATRPATAAATNTAKAATNTPVPPSTYTPVNTSTDTPVPTNTLVNTSTPTNSPTSTPYAGHRYGLVGQGGLGERIDTVLLQAQYSAGVKMRFVQLGWDVLQPSGPSSWDSGIANAFQQRIDAFVSTGPDTQMVLDMGIQYSPGWVNSIDPLVDQYGNVYQAGFPNGGVNVYWSQTVRQHVAGYIQRVFSTLNFHGRLWAVRVGPYMGELLYPERANAGQNLSFWAFDSRAQAQSPVQGWRPGDQSPNGEAEQFYYWYVDNLTSTFNFFLGEIRRYYSGYVAPVTPGAGMWQGNVSQLISRNLYDPSLQWYGTGNYWQRIFSMLPSGEQNVINWCSSMGDGSGNDQSANWWEWSSAKIQAYLAQQNGRRIYGENSAPNAYDTTGGADPRTTMQWIFGSVQDNNYLGLMWVSQSYMADSRYASLAQYQLMISQLP